MENKCYLNTDNDTEFKTRLKVGEVVVVAYNNHTLNFQNKYVSIVKDIIIDEKNNIYKCRLDNFNIDFMLYHQVPFSDVGANYSSNTEYSNVYKIEDYEQNIEKEFTVFSSAFEVKKNYKILVEAIKLREKINKQ